MKKLQSDAATAEVHERKVLDGEAKAYYAHLRARQQRREKVTNIVNSTLAGPTAVQRIYAGARDVGSVYTDITEYIERIKRHQVVDDVADNVPNAAIRPSMKSKAKSARKNTATSYGSRSQVCQWKLPERWGTAPTPSC